MVLDLFSVSLTGSWRAPIFVVVVILLIVGSQEKPPISERGKDAYTVHPDIYLKVSVPPLSWTSINLVKKKKSKFNVL